jgi:hypothetical protein
MGLLVKWHFSVYLPVRLLIASDRPIFIAMGVVNTKEKRNSNNDDTLPSEFLSNSLNELQILEGHKDIVRLLVVLDQARCLACSPARLHLLLALRADLHSSTALCTESRRLLTMARS